MSTYDLLVLGLILIGFALIAWAILNPKWQRGESYDSLAPFVIGVIVLVVASALQGLPLAVRFVKVFL